MKKIYLSVVLLALVSLTFAQRNYSVVKKFDKITNSKTPTDTIMPDGFTTGQPTINASQGGGYVFGNNGYGDKVKAQQFVVTTGYKVEGAGFWFGAKKTGSGTGTITVNIYSNNGPGTAASGAVTNAPNTVLSSIPLAWADVDTSGFTFVTFPSPVTVLGDYSIGVDVSALGTDTCGLVCTADGNGGGMDLSWEKWSDDSWNSILLAAASGGWGMDVNIAIFAIIDNSTANINDNYFVEGIKLSQNQPNPVNNSTLVQYEIQNNSNVTLELFDVTGKLVFSSDEGNQTAGLHSIFINSDNLSKGSYNYSLKADNKRLTKKMIVVK